MVHWTKREEFKDVLEKANAKKRGIKQSKEVVERRAAGNRKHGKSRQSWNYQEWRRKVLERDNNQCVECGISKNKMHCDHIIPWKDNENLRFSIDNGQTLCPSCHLKKGREKGEIPRYTEFQKGNIPYSYGSKGLKVAWNKGLKASEDTRKKQSIARKGKAPWNKGIPCSEETKIKLSKCNKGRIPHNIGIPMSYEQKIKISKSKKDQRNSISTEFQKGHVPYNKKNR